MPISKGVNWFARGSLMALAIYLGSTYLIRLATSSSPERIRTADGHLSRANEKRFRALLNDGEKALRDRQYQAAANSFVEAERSVDGLTDEQYDALKKSRLQLAEAYTNAGAEADAGDVYRAMITSALRDGNDLLRAKQPEAALRRGQDAEELCAHLTGADRPSIQGSMSLSVSALQALKRYAEAAEKQQHLIDYLKANGYDNEEGFSQNYWTLAFIDSDAKDWQGAAQAFQMGIDSCDSALAHQINEGKQPTADLTVFRNTGQFNLIISYYQEGQVSTALSKAEEFYKEYSERPSDPMHPWNVAHGADDFAALAVQIARETHRQDDIDLWSRRAPGGIKVIALHPVQNP
jgi:hypothetical protein